MKQRKDFISNSSTCSYVVSSVEPKETFYKKLQEYFKDDYSKHSDKAFQSCECFVPFEIYTRYLMPEEVPNSVLPVIMSIHGESFHGEQIDASYMDRFFDENENIKSDLKFPDCIEKFEWWTHGDNGNYFQRDIDDLTISSQVTMRSVKIAKYLEEKASEFNIKMDRDRDEKLKALNEIEKELNNSKNVYLVFFSYEGDSQSFGHIWDGHRNDGNIWEKLKRCGLVDKIIFHEDY